MHIMITIGSLQGGGAERVACLLADTWIKANHRVTIVTMECKNAKPAYTLSSDVQVIRLDQNRPAASKFAALKRIFYSLRSLRSTVHSQHPDVVVSFIDQINVLTILACKGLAIPVFISERVHPEYYDIGWFWNLLRKFTYGGAVALVVQTEDIRQWCLERFNTKVLVIPNPVCIPQNTKPNFLLKNRRIVAAGRLMYQKGFDLLIHAFARLAKDYSEWELVIYGEGEERSSLSELAKHLDLQNRVYLMGWNENLEIALLEADIFCLSSRFEGFPNVLCEAMSLGIPVVATDCPSGPQDIIVDGENGILVQTEDEIALSRGLERLITEPSLRASIGKKAKTISYRYNLSKIVTMWQELFDQHIDTQQ